MVEIVVVVFFCFPNNPPLIPLGSAKSIHREMCVRVCDAAAAATPTNRSTRNAFGLRCVAHRTVNVIRPKQRLNDFHKVALLLSTRVKCAVDAPPFARRVHGQRVSLSSSLSWPLVRSSNRKSVALIFAASALSVRSVGRFRPKVFCAGAIAIAKVFMCVRRALFPNT